MVHCRELPVSDLKEECKRKGLKGYSRLNRDELVKLCCGTAQETIERHKEQIKTQKQRIKALEAKDKEKYKPLTGLKVSKLVRKENFCEQCGECSRSLKNYAVTNYGIFGLSCLLRKMGLPPIRNIDTKGIEELPTEIYENYAESVIDQFKHPETWKAMEEYIRNYHTERNQEIKSIEQASEHTFLVILKDPRGGTYPELANFLTTHPYDPWGVQKILDIVYLIWKQVKDTKTLNKWWREQMGITRKFMEKNYPELLPK